MQKKSESGATALESYEASVRRRPSSPRTSARTAAAASLRVTPGRGSPTAGEPTRRPARSRDGHRVRRQRYGGRGLDPEALDRVAGHLLEHRRRRDAAEDGPWLVDDHGDDDARPSRGEESDERGNVSTDVVTARIELLRGPRLASHLRSEEHTSELQSPDQ